MYYLIDNDLIDIYITICSIIPRIVHSEHHLLKQIKRDSV